MSALLNPIFFIKKEHLNINNVLNVLQNYMLTNANRAAILLRSKVAFKGGKLLLSEESDSDDEVLCNEQQSQPLMQNTFVETAIVNQSLVTNELISPKQHDTLFWCLYIIHFGYGEYLEIDRNYGIKELEIKKKIGEFITSNPHKMKNTNVKITKAGVQEILSELLTSQKDTSMNCLFALLVYYNINLIIVNSSKLLMLEFISDKDSDDTPTFAVYKDEYSKYSVNITELTKEEIKDMKEKMICLENYFKPIKAASNYKVEDLEFLAKKLGIYKEDKKYKKQDLYNEIAKACIW